LLPGVFYEEYIANDNAVGMCEVHLVDQMLDETFVHLDDDNDDIIVVMEEMSLLHLLQHCRCTTDHSRAEKLWLVCGVMGDAMLCDRERVKNFMLLSILKK
jgi:hypothetical protein